MCVWLDSSRNISDPRVFDRLAAAAAKVTLAPGDREMRHLIVR